MLCVLYTQTMCGTGAANKTVSVSNYCEPSFRGRQQHTFKYLNIKELRCVRGKHAPAQLRSN